MLALSTTAHAASLSAPANRYSKTSGSIAASLNLNEVLDVTNIFSKLTPVISNAISPSSEIPLPKMWSPFNGARDFSTKSMRSKVEKRMQRESGKTLREIRRAKKLRKKLMTDEERLIYNLRRAKKKIALLLQKMKKYELPELPPSRHDPELFTLEQLQAYKKIGFRNKNYVHVGVRGVFGGVVQNMHLHWKRYDSDFVIHCKPNGLCEIVGALKGAQEEDVKAVGFGGMLRISGISVTKTDLIRWLVEI
ncbi:hypothetical protein CASFOL_008108 [Castilleja foliolosa]|uniref:CRM domain-containing protein n=1 Tax=Castilleja foliolosa TaxID=1961234 RepID=A0ABD3E1Z8_9LAMI